MLFVFIRDIDLVGPPPPDVTSLPDGNLPLYLKGRVLLQQKGPPPGATVIMGKICRARII